MLRLWRREGAEDQELQQVYKGMEILRKALVSPDACAAKAWCHGAQWQGFLQVHALRRSAFRAFRPSTCPLGGISAQDRRTCTS